MKNQHLNSQPFFTIFGNFYYLGMAGFRSAFIYGASKTAGILPTRVLQWISGQKLIFPLYHTISDEDMPHIKHLYDVKGTKAFVKDIEAICKYYQPIGYSDLAEMVKGSKELKKPSFLISFDDGLREFHDIIAPILLKKGIPAICFLNSGFIDNKALFYRYKASLLAHLFKSSPDTLNALRNNLAEKIRHANDVLSIAYKERELLNEIAVSINVSFSDFLNSHAPYLTSSQIRSLIGKGFHFGAHSIDHPEYRFLPLHEQIRQTAESTDYIYKAFNLNYRAFSFPFTDFGVSKSFFSTIHKENLADITFGCAGQKKDCISNNFQRIPFEMAHLSGKQILNSELFYYLLKAPFGKNTMHRDD